MAITTNQPVPASDGPGNIFPTAARTAATYNSPEFFNPSAKGVRLYTVVANGAGTVTVKIQVRDPNTDVWIDLSGAVTAALNNTTGSLLTVYPEGVAAANVYALNILGTSWRVVATVAGATETFSVGGEYLI